MTEIGHNNPPVYSEEEHAAFKGNVAELNDVAGAWLKNGELTDKAQSAKLTDVIRGAQKLRKEIDQKRKDEKAPHKQRAEEVDAAFNGLLRQIDAIVARLKPIQGNWLKKEAAAERERQQKAIEAANEEVDRAKQQGREAESRLDVAGMSDSDAALAEAQKKLNAASRKRRTNAPSHTGGGRTMSLTKIKTARIVHPVQAAVHFRDHPDLIASLEKIANAAIRAAGFEGQIPGVEIIEEDKAR